jgi:hypothetical protein
LVVYCGVRYHSAGARICTPTDKETCMKIAICGALAALLVAGGAGGCRADDLKATQAFSDNEIKFEPGGNYSNYTLTVAGPNGFHATASSKSQVPSIDIKRAGATDDGIYRYHLTASTDTKVPLRSGLDNGRTAEPATMLQGVSASGHFELKGGAIVKFDPNAREDVKRQK